MTFLKMFSRRIRLNDIGVEAIDESAALQDNFAETEGPSQLPLSSCQVSVTFNLNRVRTFERRRKGTRPILSCMGAAQSRPERIQELPRLGCSYRFIPNLQKCSFNTVSQSSAPKSPITKIGRPKKITAEVLNDINTLSSLD
jgi:hypothetical protein